MDGGFSVPVADSALHGIVTGPGQHCRWTRPSPGSLDEGQADLCNNGIHRLVEYLNAARLRQESSDLLGIPDAFKPDLKTFKPEDDEVGKRAADEAKEQAEEMAAATRKAAAAAEAAQSVDASRLAAEARAAEAAARALSPARSQRVRV